MDLTPAHGPFGGPDTPQSDGSPVAATSDWKIIATLAFVAIAGTGSSAVIYAATPMFINVFPDPKIIGWMTSIYFIVGAVAAGLCGGIGDLYGRRATMIWILMLVSAAGIVAGSLSNPVYVVACHAIQGLGVAAPTLNMGMLRENVAPKRLPLAIAIVTTATTTTAGLFFMLAGYIMDHGNWRYIFWFAPVLLVPAVLLMLAFIPASRPARTPRAIPVLNGLLFGLAALFLMIGVGELSQNGMATRPFVLLALGVVFLLGWIRNSLVTPTPMVDVRMLGQRGLAAVMVVYALLSLTLFHIGHVLLFVGKASPLGGYGAGLTGTAVAAIMVPQGFIGLIVGPFTGLIVQRCGHFWVFLTTLCFISAPYVVLLLFDHDYVTLLFTVVAGGITAGAMAPAFRIALQAEVDVSRASSAMGLAELLRALCMGLGAQVVASALVHGGAGQPNPALDPARFNLLMLGFIVLMAIAAATYAAFGSRKGTIA